MAMEEIIETSKDPQKQLVLDYMKYHGVQIMRKKRGMDLYVLDASNVTDWNEFANLTNYHAVSYLGFVGVKKNPPYDKAETVFSTLNDAYNAMKFLYDIMTSAPADADF